ncbi:MAG: sigma 54-interacting transcriptional regulator [Leptospirillia bacterium]
MDTSGIQVLVLSSDPAWVKRLLVALDPLGAEVSVPREPTDAISACADIDYPLIFADAGKGEATVVDFCWTLRALPEERFGVLVAVAEPTATETLAQMLTNGADEILTKDLPDALLEVRLDALVRHARRRLGKLGVDHSLKESEARLRAVVDTVVDGIITIDEMGLIVGFNPAAERIFGYTAGEVMGKNVKILMPEPYRGEHDSYLANYTSTGKAKVIGYGREVEGRRKDGSVFPMELAIDDTRVGDTRLFTGIVRDISERRAAELRIQSDTALFESISQIQSQHIQAQDMNTLCDDMLARLLDLTGSEYGFIGEMLHTPEGAPYLKTRAISDIAWNDESRKFYDENVARGLEFFNLDTLFGEVLKTRWPVIADDPENDPRSGGLPEGHPPLNTFLGHPLIVGNEMLGMVGIANRPGGYDEELLTFLQPLLNTVANIILAHRNETERKRAVEALEKSHEDLLSILNGLRIGVAIADESERVAFLSDSAGEMCGKSTAEAVGQIWHECIPVKPDDARQVRAVAALPPEQRSKVPLQFTSRKGRDYWLEMEVQDDPRDTRRKIFLIYDISELHELQQMVDGKSEFQNMVGKSSAMQVVFHQIEEVAQGDWTVLIEGKTGTGKELAANAIHARSHRKDGPFIAVNAAGLTDSILASQLFGHKRGSFTGAVEDHKGLFEAAEGGTIFLDEIGDIPPGVQTSLLRVLQEREITRLGESTPRKVDVRVLAATNRNLAEEVEAGRFRADLLYRLRVARIEMPPLQQRRSDIPLLIQATLKRLQDRDGSTVNSASKNVLRRMTEYPWPGNVRELVHAVEYAVIRARGNTLHSRDLPPEIQMASPNGTGTPVPGEAEASPPPDEREQLLDTLTRTRGNRARAAQLLGMSRATLYRRLKEFGIPAKSSR